MDIETENKCIYCGSDSNLEREHVIPVVFWGFRSYDDKRQWIVTACRHCNSLASTKLFFSIPEKANYILSRYKTKFKKILRTPTWTEEELKDLDYVLRKNVESNLLARSVLGSRMRHLEIVSFYQKDYLRPRWVQLLFEEWKKATKKSKPNRKKGIIITLK